MQFETLAHVDAAIRDALARIARQRDFIEEFAAKGYDMRAALSLLSSLLVNLCRLENHRRTMTAELEDVAGV